MNSSLGFYVQELCVTYRVTVVGARGLPQMDILGSTDPYALLFLAEPLGESVTGQSQEIEHVQSRTSAHPILAAGAITYRTETARKTREPTWNADFELPIFAMATVLFACKCAMLIRDARLYTCALHSCHLRACMHAGTFPARHTHAMVISFIFRKGFSQFVAYQFNGAPSKTPSTSSGVHEDIY